jgi:hypothetical protein
MRAKERFALGVIAAVAVGGRLAAQQSLDRRQAERVERALRQEGEAVVALADAADSQSGPADFFLDWHNDFLKARTGTFIPFIVSIDASHLKAPAALLYVRAARRPAADPRDRPNRRIGAGSAVTRFPFEEIYPVDFASEEGQLVRVVRGFSLEPGEYDMTVVVREREHDDRRRKRMAAVLRRPLSVPDFSSSELSASTVILADRLTVLPESTTSELQAHPYVIAGRDIQPAADRVFRRSEELIVVFLVYNPVVTPDKQFDLEVEYHFYRKTGGGDTYISRTEPQRFIPASLGPQYDPAAGHPILAGQGVPLTSFEEGVYRLAIKVTDRISGRSLRREVSFTVRS